jgi:hypothetical protein
MRFLHRLTTTYPSGPEAEGVPPVPSFVTPQSIVTFPVAALVVNVFWQLLGKASTSLTKQWVPIVLSALVAAFIYAASDKSGMNAKAKWVAAGIALINAGFLAAAALGLDTALPGQAGVGGH